MVSFVDFVYALGLTLAAGSSTFALIFFIRALQDGVIDASEKRLMHTVYFVLRIGMFTILAALIGYTVFGAFSPALWLKWALLGIITLNAFLMTKRIMPMHYGPIVAGGSWYSLFFVSQTPIASLGYLVCAIAYILFLILFYTVYEYLKRRFIPAHGTFSGEVRTDTQTREVYATDASAFKRVPQAIYYPKSVTDIQNLVAMVHENRKKGGTASLTVRAGGTDMSGGPLSSSWVVDLTKHLTAISIDPVAQTATVETGAYFRDIEEAARLHGLMFAPYPSSHLLCGIGGMLGNNASGEKSIRFGPTSNNVLSLEAVLADGSLFSAAPKPIEAATSRIEQGVAALYTRFGAALKKATGNVTKAASGYRLEKVIDKKTFNAVPLFVGAQGTLGIITKATLKLVPIPEHRELILISAKTLLALPEIMKTVLAYNPEAVETFDINTFKKAQEHLPEHARAILPFIDASAHLFILAEFSEKTKKITEKQADACMEALEKKDCFTCHAHEAWRVHRIHDPRIIDSAWQIRRNSFTLMRDHNADGFRAVPCIEDVIVPVTALGAFIEGLAKILKKRKIAYGFHGHIGDGSFRVIPVFDFRSKTLEKDIAGLMEDVFRLVKKLKGNISADHSDGIIRTPYLQEFYGEKLYGAFVEIKKLFDPENIMNPNKKVGGTVELLNASLNKS